MAHVLCILFLASGLKQFMSRNMLKEDKTEQRPFQSGNESSLQMISLKLLWKLSLNLAEFYDRQGRMGTHPSHAVFLVLSLDIQEAFIAETLGNTMASILKVSLQSIQALINWAAAAWTSGKNGVR